VRRSAADASVGMGVVSDKAVGLTSTEDSCDLVKASAVWRSSEQQHSGSKQSRDLTERD